MEDLLAAKILVSPVPGERQVSIEENGREPVVRFLLEENRRETVVHFLLEEHGRSFAARQRRRLKLITPPKTLEGEAGIIATSAM